MTTLPARADEIHASMPVVDGHNDLPWALRARAGGDLTAADPARHLDGMHTDGPRLRQGGVGGQFWSVYVPSTLPHPFATVLEQLDLVDRMVANDPEHLADATTARDVAVAAASGRTGSLRGAEGGHAIESDLGKLAELRDRGVRYLTLTHTETIPWADSATDRAIHGGLTAFGRRVVEAMNDLGIIVDVSHTSTATALQAIETSQRPVLASHSGVAAIAPHPRNVGDEVLEAVARNGGAVLVPFYPPFLVAQTARALADAVAWARRLDIDDPVELERRIAARHASLDLPRGSVRDVVAHIEHIVAVAGIDHVGLGSDFDGIDMTVEGLEDVSTYPAITEELLARGWDPSDIRKVLGGNVLRVLEAND